MKQMKLGIVALVIAVLAITAVAVAAQTSDGTTTPPAAGQDQSQPPAKGQGQGQRPGRGQGQGQGQGIRFGGEFQVIADALGVDLATLRTDLQSGKSIADIATEKNVELSTVVDAVVAERQTALDTAVTDGRLTQEQADAQITLLKANLDTLFTQKFDQQLGNRPGLTERTNPILEIIAAALGEDVTTLQTDLKAGKTVAEIAAEKNVELSTVVDAVVAERQTNITAAVTDGRLTQEQADAQIALLKADLNAAFTSKIDANGRGFGLGGFGGPMGGMGGFDGPMGGMGGFDGPMGGFGGPGGRQHGNGGPMGPGGMGPGNDAPPAPDATPEATAAANA